MKCNICGNKIKNSENYTKYFKNNGGKIKYFHKECSDIMPLNMIDKLKKAIGFKTKKDKNENNV